MVCGFSDNVTSSDLTGLESLAMRATAPASKECRKIGIKIWPLPINSHAARHQGSRRPPLSDSAIGRNRSWIAPPAAKRKRATPEGRPSPPCAVRGARNPPANPPGQGPPIAGLWLRAALRRPRKWNADRILAAGKPGTGHPQLCPRESSVIPVCPPIHPRMRGWTGRDRRGGARRRVSRVLSRPLGAGGDGHSSGTPVAERLMRPTRAAARRPARHRRIAPGRLPLLLGLAPGGVFPAAAVAGGAVRSYRTVSPLPPAP